MVRARFAAARRDASPADSATDAGTEPTVGAGGGANNGVGTSSAAAAAGVAGASAVAATENPLTKVWTEE